MVGQAEGIEEQPELYELIRASHFLFVKKFNESALGWSVHSAVLESTPGDLVRLEERGLPN